MAVRQRLAGDAQPRHLKGNCHQLSCQDFQSSKEPNLRQKRFRGHNTISETIVERWILCEIFMHSQHTSLAMPHFSMTRFAAHQCALC